MKVRVQILLLTLFIVGQVSFAADWPQWRHDAKRSGATDEELPRSMKQQWMLSLGKPAPAYEHQFRMCADFSYAPVAGEGLLFVPSSVTDQVMAFDLATGSLKWRYVTEGPVRFAPVYNKGRVYFASDDGYLYCVDAKSGKLAWRTRGVPKNIPDMLMLVNGRMVSRWPARGAPVLHGDLVYFGAGIWPEEGVYQNAVDAQTGKLIWQSDALSIVKDGMNDHGVDYDLSLPPHGYSAVINGKLGVTSGRTLAAWFDLESGTLDPYTCFYVKFAVPRGAWYIAGNDNFWMQGGNLFGAHSEAAPPRPAELKDLGTPLQFSRKTPETANYVLKHRPFLCSDKPNKATGGEGYENSYADPVFAGDIVYSATYDDSAEFQVLRGHTYVRFPPYDKIIARDLTNPKWTVIKGAGKSKTDVAVVEFPVKWELKTPMRVLMKAGGHLIAGEANRIVAIAIPKKGEKPKIVWEAKIDGNPINTLLADGKLVTVTDTGRIHCFGAGAQSNSGLPVAETVEMSPKNGFALVLGWGDGKKVAELANDPDWRVVVLEKDAAKVVAARKALNGQGLNGRRVQVIVARESLELTPYWASLVVVNDESLIGQKTWQMAVDAMRPFTGKMLNASAAAKKLVAGRIDYKLEGSSLMRISAPEGAADWTHETGGADNSFVSQDQLVKWPLGILWYSGDIDRFFPPESHYQHERNPYPLIKDGRMYLITFDMLHAVDVYTGDYLWKTKMPDSPYFNTRLLDSRVYGRPTERNYSLANDLVYCVTEDKIISYDVKTGQQVKEFPVPEQLKASAREAVEKVKEKRGSTPTQAVPEWTEVRLWGDLLIAKVGHSLIAVDRHSGKVKWIRKGTMEETTYTIGGNALYGLDCPTDSYSPEEEQHAMTGLLFALNPADGNEIWERQLNYVSRPKESNAVSIRSWMKPPTPFLGYNAKHKLLVVTYNGNNVIVSKANDGSELWTLKNPDMEADTRIYSPNILDDHLMLSLSKYSGGMGYMVDILTGKKLQDTVEVPRARTCGRIVGNDHLMTYRDASAEMFDIDSGLTIPFNSMRAGCTTSFIPANGVMAAPMLQHGCVCNYPMFSSLAMVHMPGIDALRPEAVMKSWGADQLEQAAAPAKKGERKGPGKKRKKKKQS